MITDQFGKKWYKGNLHTHSTNSDGRLSPEEVIGLYREEGYDFLALTDHWFMGEERQEENFLLLSGAEYDVGNNVRDGIYHVVGIAMQKEPKLEKGPELQEKQAQLMIDRIHEAGGIAILAHPAWSMNRASEVCLLKDLDGCEIYNTTSGRGTVDPIRALSWMNWQRRDMCCPAWQRTTRISTQATKQNLT